MEYIVVDFEWNQPGKDNETITDPFSFVAEIIQIGAVKLSQKFEVIDEYRGFIKPFFYPILNGGVLGLTRLPAEEIKKADTFPKAFESFVEWCGEEFCFFTWGPNDIPVLMDNLIMHNISIDSLPDSYDIQRIFGHEIARDDKQYSLENAIKLLKRPMKRAHDALNDALATVEICNFMDLSQYLEEYRMSYVSYYEDRIKGFISDRKFASLAELQQDEEYTTVICPYCQARITFGEWAVKNNRMFGYSVCDDGDEYIGSYRILRKKDGSIMSKRCVYEMSTDLWDTYQKTLEAQQGKTND